MAESAGTHYLSLRDVLVSGERLPCELLAGLPRLGFLDPSSAEANVPAGAELELPLWLAEALRARRPPLLAVRLPRAYREAYREILHADAAAVDLHTLARHFYELGCRVARYDIKGDVGATLIDTFRQRFRLVLDAAAAGDATGALQRLSESERARAAAAATGARAVRDWLRSGRARLETASTVASHRKRKRDQMEAP